ncbi:hypothetical protein IQ269_00740 [Tychonema sp. LEGE 07199]|uniref:hypothetical protein n=1 Tax=unclassified Tychonema TaxID=2642144 RepID=UPI001881BDA9|nr:MULTISPECIES: hypothetical protein [unclassified Tychonema]MBE9119368.1 hypothetical protein [Tychonema sp. LEGE 07199]MBE9130545.1 hypothetical protein [Tychonema sp. LEGE 07196]
MYSLSVLWYEVLSGIGHRAYLTTLENRYTYLAIAIAADYSLIFHRQFCAVLAMSNTDLAVLALEVSPRLERKKSRDGWIFVAAMWFLISFPIASELYILMLDSGSVPASDRRRSSGTLPLYNS